MVESYQRVEDIRNIRIRYKNSNEELCTSACKNSTIGTKTTRVIFEMFYEQVTWHEAEEKCRDKSNETSLAAFFSEEEHDLIISQQATSGLPPLVAWIGGRAQRSQRDQRVVKNKLPMATRSWEWIVGRNGKDPEPICYHSWSENEPNGELRNEDCIETYSTNENIYWNDQNCDDRDEAYICQTRQPLE